MLGSYYNKAKNEFRTHRAPVAPREKGVGFASTSSNEDTGSNGQDPETLRYQESRKNYIDKNFDMTMIKKFPNASLSKSIYRSKVELQ